MQKPKNMETIEATEIALEIVKFGVALCKEKGLHPSSRPFDIALRATTNRENYPERDALLVESFESDCR